MVVVTLTIKFLLLRLIKIGMEITIMDDFLSHDDLLFYQQYVMKKNLHQNIIEDETVTKDFWSKYGEKVNSCIQCSGLYPNVTITNSKKPVIRHIDGKFHDEKYKLLIYLNTIPKGGTIFYMDKKHQLVENKENRAVIFDMALSHESQAFVYKDTKKMAIGFRLKP